MTKLSSGLTRLIQATLIAAWASVIALAAFPTSAAVEPADKRVALIIGNGAYQSAVRLDNAVFDAKAVGRLLPGAVWQIVSTSFSSL